MCSFHFIVPVLAGFFLMKVLLHRFMWRRRMGHFRGGCGGRHGWRGRHDRHGDWQQREQVFVRHERATVDETVDVRAQLQALFQSLELASAQRDEVDEVMAVARDTVGEEGVARWTGLVAALGLVAGETFDPIKVAGALGPNATKNLVDGLEHLHNILLPEQAQQLKQGVAALMNAHWS